MDKGGVWKSLSGYTHEKRGGAKPETVRKNSLWPVKKRDEWLRDESGSGVSSAAERAGGREATESSLHLLAVMTLSQPPAPAETCLQTARHTRGGGRRTWKTHKISF